MDRKPGRVKKGNGQRILLGMSGGVDSTASLILLKENGWDPVGVSFIFSTWCKGTNCYENPKSSEYSIRKAAEICKNYGCEHHTVDLKKDFEENVIEYFTNSLENNLIPNPCVVCNKTTKFYHLFKFADSMGIKHIATGHYAKIIKSGKYKSYFISIPRDKEKDQTYYLSLLPQEWVERIVFPLGQYLKNEIYKLVRENGLDFYIEEPQSQDFCFISESTIDEFIGKEIGNKSGNIVNTKGEILGKHKGLPHYTIGQRKGIGLPGGPYYVMDKDTKENTLTVSKNKKDLEKTKIKLRDIFFTKKEFYGKSFIIKAKIRYQQKLSTAKLKPISKEGTEYQISFNKPQVGVTPGQYCVFYIGNLCIGSGVIH